MVENRVVKDIVEEEEKRLVKEEDITYLDPEIKRDNFSNLIIVYQSKQELINELINRPKDCKIDDGEDKWLVRFFESPDKSKYYKMVFMDWCAPGPCSMFGTVELF